MTKKASSPQRAIRYHNVYLNGPHFPSNIVRTDGVKYEKRCTEVLDPYASLAVLVPKLTEVLNKYPDASLDQDQKRFEDGYDTVIEWWEPLEENDPLVEHLLASAKKAEKDQRERDERELKRLKTERPDLFD